MASQTSKPVLNGDAGPSVEERTTHIQALIDRLIANSPIYKILLSSISLINTTPGLVTTRLTLDSNHVNSRGGLHGAVSATIIDFTTGLAIASHDLRQTTGASVDMHISYLSSARVGDTVEIEARADKVGGSMGFTTCRISKVEEDGGLTAVTIGQHTKYLRVGNGKPKGAEQSTKEQ